MCLLLAAIFAVSAARFVSRSVAAAGTVTGVSQNASADDGKTYYYPEFSFVAQDGKTYTAASNTGSTSPAYTVGQSVRILYDKTNPNSARIDSFGQIWGGSLLFALCGVVFLSISAALNSAQKRKAAAALPSGS